MELGKNWGKSHRGLLICRYLSGVSQEISGDPDRKSVFNRVFLNINTMMSGDVNSLCMSRFAIYKDLSLIIWLLRLHSQYLDVQRNTKTASVIIHFIEN